MPELRPNPSSFADPAGTVFEADDFILRGITPEFAPFFRELLDRAFVRELLDGRIIDTRIATESLPGFSLVLKHRKLEPLSFPFEWPPAMLLDAALMTLELCRVLAREGLTLQDGSAWNVVFEGPAPRFVDFTSIVPQQKHLPWAAYDQFCRHFLFPLTLYRYRPFTVVRTYLMDSIGGMDVEDFIQLLPIRAGLDFRWLWFRVHLPRLGLKLLRRFEQEGKLSQWTDKIELNRKQREDFFDQLVSDVRTLAVKPSASQWTDYYEDMDQFFDASNSSPKQACVRELLDRCRPGTVVDIGCNEGGYSILAAMAGAKVIAFDSDPSCVGRLYRLAKAKQLPILSLVMDCLHPSPACGWRAVQFESGPARFKADMALGLALVHHLAITQRQTFDRITATLADYAGRWLLTEFVPLDDPRSKELLVTNQRDLSWYTLPAFRGSLEKVFARTTLFPSSPEGRTLVFCER